MPELPEVETVRQGLAEQVTGRLVESVSVLHPRAVRRHAAGSTDFIARLEGRRFGTPRRRGKYLWLPLDSGEALVAHLGMSGQFRVAHHDADVVPHLRVRLRLVDGLEMRFVDQRTFGGMAVEPMDAAGIPMSVRHIGLDPFDERYNLEAAAEALMARRTELKRALLDQTVVSGIGNVYADEALWLAELHFARPTDRLRRAQALLALQSAADVMTAALAQGGTSFDALYVNVNGASGYFERSLEAYGREGEPCSRCGGPIRRVSFTNRSSYFCPRCQRAPRHRTGGATSVRRRGAR